MGIYSRSFRNFLPVITKTNIFLILSDTIRFGAILEGRQYKGLKLTKRIFTDVKHCEVIAPGFQWGLQLALKK